MNSWLWPADSQRTRSVLLLHPFQNWGAYKYRLTFYLTLPAPPSPTPRGSLPLISLTSSAGFNHGSCWITGSSRKAEEEKQLPKTSLTNFPPLSLNISRVFSPSSRPLVASSWVLSNLAKVLALLHLVSSGCLP